MIDPSQWTKWDPSRDLDVPFRWRKARHVVVKGDVFDGSRTNEEIAAVFGVMAVASQHTFQVLTKRPERMRDWFNWIREEAEELQGAVGERPPSGHAEPSACVMLALRGDDLLRATANARWPLPNVWLGVSVDCQAHADARIPLLLETPAALRFVSAEPLLGQIDFGDALAEQGHESGGPQGWVVTREPLDWVIVGGETGRDARPCDVEWIRQIVRQCKAAGVPVFVRQIGSTPHIGDGGAGMSHYLTGSRESCWAMDDESTTPITVYEIRDRKGADPDEWPVDIRVREMPEVRP